MLTDIFNKAKKLENIYRWKKALPENPEHNDIYMVEFPKSGITWLIFLIGNIELQLAELDEVITYFNFHHYIPDIHQLKGVPIRRTLPRTFIKSHHEYNPYYYFIVYLMRNPVDALISYYNFMRGFGYADTFFNFVKSGEYGVSKWKRHVNSWFCNRTDAHRVHVLKYENLLSDTKGEIKTLYTNFGVNVTDEIIEKSMERSALGNMKESEMMFRHYSPNSQNRVFVGKESKLLKKDILTEEIRAYILHGSAAELKRFYPELMEQG